MRSGFLLLILAAYSAADSPTLEDAVAAVQKAMRGEEAATLRILAERNTPDPWRIVADLCARGEFETADAFARAAPRADTGGLAKQVDMWRKSPVAAEDLKTLAAALAEIDAGATAAAIEKLDTLDAVGESLWSAQQAEARARATGKPQDHELAASTAKKIGWLRLAADSRRAQAKALEQRGDPDGALSAANAWLAIETGRGDQARLPVALTEAGRLSLEANRAPEAEDLARRAVRQAERAKDTAATARAQALLGRVLLARGARSDARAYLLKARKTLGADRDADQRLDVLESLIQLDAQMEGIDAGLARAKEMLALARQHTRPEAEGRALAAMARMQLQRKDWSSAARLFTEAEAAFRRAKRNADAAGAAFERGSLALRMGRLDEAGTALSGALELAGEDGPKLLRARVHAALGEWAVDTGNEKAAEVHLEAAAKLAVEIENSGLAARTLARRGRLALRRRQWDDARRILERALEEERKTGAKAEIARTLLDIATIDLHEKKPDAAQARAREAADFARAAKAPAPLARAAAVDARSRVGREKAESIISRVRTGAREAITVLEAQGAPTNARLERALADLLMVGTDAAIVANDARTLLAAGEYRRARMVLQALGGRASLIRVLTPRELTTAMDKERENEQRALVAYQGFRKKMSRDDMLLARAKVKAARAALAALRARQDEFIAPARWMLSPGVPTIPAVQAALAPTETLLYFCAGSDSVAVLKITNVGVEILPIGKRAVLEQDVARLREALRGEDPFSAIRVFTEARIAPLGLAKGRDLVVISAEPFDQVPLAALTREQTLRHVASASELVRLAARKDEIGAGVLGVGNPEFGGDEARIRLVHLRNGIPLRRLETGAKLAEEIGDTVLVGQRATESDVRTSLRSRKRWHAIHLAIPGLLDSTRPDLSSLALAPGKDEDGLLTVYDLIRLRLPADLTVLAACEPAKGTTDVEPAIQGMTLGVQLAGSSRVIVSQWWVEDGATGVLMKYFYRYWAEGKTSAPLALRRAQEKVSELHGWAHPKAWAAWQLWGAR